MKIGLSKSLTLLELIIGLVLLTIVVLTLSSVDFFSRTHIITSSRMATLSNEVSLALEHMSKEITRAIGNTAIAEQDPINLDNISGDSAIRVYVDQNQNGQRDDPGEGDRWIAYRWTAANGNQNDRYQIWYCPDCQNNQCTRCDPVWGNAGNIVARHISQFTPLQPANTNYVEVEITACWNPTDAGCGTVNNPANPAVRMRSRIRMPSVSNN